MADAQRMRRLLVILLLLGVGTLAVAFLPMRALTAIVPGLGADGAPGTIWKGRLEGARYRGLALGDLDLALRAAPLLSGRAELSFVRSVPEIRGQAVIGGGAIAVSGLDGRIEVPLLQDRIPAAPPLTLAVSDARLLLGQEDGCRAAAGEVRAEVRGLPVIGSLPLTSGTLGCDGDAVAARLATPRGDTLLTLRGWIDGRWAADLRIEASDPGRRAALTVLGFRPVAGGMAYRVEGGGAP